MATVTVRWEIEDGYVGGSKPQSFEIDTDDFDEDLDILNQLYDFTQEQFDNTISWYIQNEDEVVRVVEAARKRNG